MIHRPVNTALCLGLLLFGVSIISFILLLQHQLEQKFERDLKDVDVVVGAKGSPLQLVLSAIYHLDAPTGNILLRDAKEVTDHPMVKEAIPLAYGDSYRGYRILGTTAAYVEKYEATFADGEMYQKPMEAVLGAAVAKASGLQIGSTFIGTHGEVQGGHVHDEHPYTVVGILNYTQTVLDQLVLTDVTSVWQVHSDHADHADHADHEDHTMSAIDSIHATQLDFHHDHHDHDHDHDHDHGHHDHDHGDDVITADSSEITALLLQYKNKMSVISMPRVINEQTNMQAVLPALEINRLWYNIGLGVTTLKFIAGGIMFMAGVSVFLVLFSRLRSRKYELALLRSVGYRPRHLFGLLIIEGLCLAVIGYILGWILSRVALYFINKQATADYNVPLEAHWVPGEEWIFLLTILIGVLSAFIPAWIAMRIDVASILSDTRK